MMCSDSINYHQTDEFYCAGNAHPTQHTPLPDLLHPDTTPGTPLIWHRPANCPSLHRFPHYTVAHPTTDTYTLKGIHFRYEPYKDRAKLWLPLHHQTIPGTTLHRYHPITQTLHDPTTNHILHVPPHNLCQSRHPQRGYIRLGYNATQYFKDVHNIHETRLVNNPHITVTLTPSTYQQPTGPPNKWKPEFLNQAYKLGLLEETAYSLNYDTILDFDIRFDGGGRKSRPDIITIMGKTVNGATKSNLVIIEGKACQNQRAKYYILQGIIQALYKKVCQSEYSRAKNAVVAITGQVNKLPWQELIKHLKNAEELPYDNRTRFCGQKIWTTIRTEQEYWQKWYEEDFHVHGIDVLLQLASNRTLQEKNKIIESLHQIQWR